MSDSVSQEFVKLVLDGQTKMELSISKLADSVTTMAGSMARMDERHIHDIEDKKRIYKRLDALDEKNELTNKRISIIRDTATKNTWVIDSAKAGFYLIIGGVSSVAVAYFSGILGS